MTESWVTNSTRDAKGDHVVMVLEVEGPTGLRPDPPRVSTGSREQHGRLSSDQTAAHVERTTPTILEEVDVADGVGKDGAGPTGLGLEPRLDEIRSDTPRARLRAGGGTGCATSLSPRLDVLSAHGTKTPPVGELLVAEELAAFPHGNSSVDLVDEDGGLLALAWAALQPAPAAVQGSTRPLPKLGHAGRYQSTLPPILDSGRKE